MYVQLLKLLLDSYILKQETPDQDKAVFDTLVFLIYGDDPFKVGRCHGCLLENIYIFALLNLKTVSIILYIQSLTGREHQEAPGLDI